MLETIHPLTFVTVAIFPLVYAEPIDFSIVPLTDIRVTKDTLPDAIALFDTLEPLAVVHFTVSPGVDALTVRPIVHELAQVC